MEPKTKKGLIIGGSIAAIVLLGASVGLGVYYGTKDKLVDADDKVKTWGYDDQVSSTAKKINWYMGTDTEVVTGTYGGAAVSSEKVLLLNENYNSVLDDIDILDGVAGSKNGLGYLSSAWVASYTDEEMRMLSAYDEVTGTFLNPEEEIKNPEHTYDQMVNSDSDKTYTEADLNGVTLEEGGLTVNGSGNLEDKYGEMTKGSEPMNATLNIHMKLPKTAADYFRPLISATPTAITATPDTEQQSYLDWLAANDYADDLMLSIALFDFMAFDSSNITSINTMLIPGTSETGIGEFEADDWEVLNTEYQKIEGADKTLTEALVEQQNNQGGTFSILIDGTGTNTGIAKAEIKNFENEFESFSGKKLNFIYDLDNGGSGEGWKLPKTEIPGTTGSAESNARANAFLGTQSRFSKSSEYTSWGYDEADYTGADATTGMYKDPSTTTAGDVIGYTMGVDLPVFFVQEDMVLEFTPNETFTTEHADMVIGGETLTTGNEYSIKPTGITPEGAKEIYQNGASWETVINLGLVQIELV